MDELLELIQVEIQSLTLVNGELVGYLDHLSYTIGFRVDDEGLHDLIGYTYDRNEEVLLERRSIGTVADALSLMGLESAQDTSTDPVLTLTHQKYFRLITDEYDGFEDGPSPIGAVVELLADVAEIDEVRAAQYVDALIRHNKLILDEDNNVRPA